jgi:hypothetical protein
MVDANGTYLQVGPPGTKRCYGFMHSYGQQII